MYNMFLAGQNGHGKHRQQITHMSQEMPTGEGVEMHKLPWTNNSLITQWLRAIRHGGTSDKHREVKLCMQPAFCRGSAHCQLCSVSQLG